MNLKKIFSFLTAAVIILNVICIIPIKAKAEKGTDIVSTVPGDVNGDFEFTDQDAVYLLFCVFFPDTYSVNGCSDFNGDGEFTDQDAIYLLFSLFFPDTYPLPETSLNSYNFSEEAKQI